jgi:hypothetical protein
MPQRRSASAEGVGAWLASDRPGTGRNIIDLCSHDTPSFAAGARQIVSKLASYGLRPGAL